MRKLASVVLVLLLGAPVVMAADKASEAKSSGIDLNAIDKSVDPCTDFYQYACGNWRKNNPIPADKSRWGRFDELAQNNRKVLHEILEDVKDNTKKRTPIEAQVGDYYAACMDEKGIEAKGAAPIKPQLDDISAIKDKKQLIDEIAKLHNQGISALFGFGVGSDLKDSNKTIANLFQGGLGLPDRDYYLKEDAKSKETREKYVAHVQKMLELLGDPSDKAAAEAKSVMNIETQLANAAMDRVMLRDPKNRDHKMSVQELAAAAPSFQFVSYLKDSGLSKVETINVVPPDFFKQVSATIDSVSLDDWKAYLRWRVVRAAASALSSPFVNEEFDFNGRFMRGAKEMEPRWERCVRSTDGDLGEALGQLYVAKTFGPEGKARMKKMVDALTASIEQNIKDLDWMTPETKKRALEKLAAFNRSKVGYPDKWRDYSSVKISRTDYAGNSLRANQFEVKRNRNKWGKPVDRTEWGMTPPTVNAYYNSANNEIVFPAGILQPPFFNRDAVDAVNFGGIGAVIGHEYTHGFDDQGRKFDAHGNFTDWWTADDAKAFEERASCIADEYSGFVSVKGDKPEDDVHLNGRLTLGENTADNGGVRVAYRALEATLEGKPKEEIDGYSPEQLFFLGYAQVWCQNARDESLRVLAKTDPHSPGEFRVNGVLQNSAEFDQAYGCKAGNKMVSEKACRVW